MRIVAFQRQYDATAIVVACLRAWIAGSMASTILTFSVAIFDETLQSGVTLVGLLALLFGALGLFAVFAFVSLPFMAVIATPAALGVATAFGNRPLVNAAIGACLGCCAGLLTQQWLGPEFFFADFLLLGAGLGAIYGAATGHQVTRMIYA